MSLDFEIPPDAKAVRAKVRKWVHDECIPAEKKLLSGARRLAATIYRTVMGLCAPLSGGGVPRRCAIVLS